MEPVSEELRRLLPEGRVVTDPGVVAGYLRDEAHLVEPGEPACVVTARTTEDVVTVLHWADTHRVPVVPRGGGTGLAGGSTATDGAIVLSLARMTAIREISVADQVAVAEPGVINADLDRAAREHGLMYAPDPSSFEISTIGGNIATNAGGLRCVKYGVTRDSVLGLEVVLAGGRLLRTGHRTVKGVAGYDLTALFVGSEGTLGVVTGATLKLRPRPAGEPMTAVGRFPTLRSAGEAVAAVVRSGLQPSMLELIDRAHLRAIDDLTKNGVSEGDAAAMLVAQADGADADAAVAAMAAAFSAAGAVDAMVSTDATEAAELVAIRRMAFSATERLGRNLVEDVGVPRSKLPDMLERIDSAAARHDVLIATVAHAGDGNLHPVFIIPFDVPGVPDNVWAAADEVFTSALELGGTLTGEHGVGALKRRWLADELGEESMAVHHAIKTALDPNQILNPGKAI